MSEEKTSVMQDYRRHSSDTGSVEVQTALMTYEITNLTKHLKEHPADFQNRRSLISTVTKRKRLLAYFKRKSPELHGALIKRLGLKK